MKTNELRIGNLVTLGEKQRNELWDINEIDATGSYFEIDVIYGDGDVILKVDNESIDFDLTDIEPIKLTEDLFLKLDKINEKLMIDGYGIVIFKNGYVYQFVKEDYPYLHQLQNVFFALTNEELNIEL